MSYYQIKKFDITHNIPEEKTVCKSYVNPVFKTYDNYVYKYTRAFITKEQLENLSQWVMWCTESTSTEFGVLFIYDEDRKKVIATKLGIDPHFPDLIALFPVMPLRINTFKLTTWPERKVKIFNTKEEWFEDREKKEKKRQEKRAEYDEIVDKIEKTNPAFSLKTPKLRVVEVLSKTKKLKAKVGDIIQGEMPVLEKDDDGSICGCFFANYTNYIDCYVNDEKVKTISPVHFQLIFEENYLVEIVNEQYPTAERKP